MHTGMIVSDPTESFYSLLQGCIRVLSRIFKLKKKKDSRTRNLPYMLGTTRLRTHWKAGIQNHINLRDNKKFKDLKKWKDIRDYTHYDIRDISDSALFWGYQISTFVTLHVNSYRQSFKHNILFGSSQNIVENIIIQFLHKLVEFM